MVSCRLRVLARPEVELAEATLSITGCFTTENWAALLPIIRRTQTLLGGKSVSVNLCGKSADRALAQNAITG
ncbi:hypothetical protein GCM10027404_12400 [Arthrobacter tumbae]